MFTRASNVGATKKGDTYFIRHGSTVSLFRKEESYSKLLCTYCRDPAGNGWTAFKKNNIIIAHQKWIKVVRLSKIKEMFGKDASALIGLGLHKAQHGR